MKYLVLSDMHVDFNFMLYNKKHQNDWSDEQANDTFTKWWNMKQLPQSEGIVIAGDISNDARSWKQNNYYGKTSWLSRRKLFTGI